nr:MAG: putative maturation protein [Leviviridae sp.]
MSRSRNYSFAGYRGRIKTSPTGAWSTEAAWTQINDTCVDDVGWPAPHALTINKLDYDISPLDGIYKFAPSLPGTWGEYDQYYLEPQNAMTSTLGGVSGTTHLALPPSPTLSQLTTSLASRTNPSRPYVSVPNFVFELKDLPRMLHDIMAIKLHFSKAVRQANLEQFAANQYLAGVMGWRPLISDIRKMMEFRNIVEKRTTELHRLYSKGGLRRTVGRVNPKSGSFEGGLDSAVATHGWTGYSVANRGSGTPYYERNMRTERRTWGTCRWTPTALPKDLSDIALRRLANSLVFGLNLRPGILWEALPWSWLFDWFANVGDYINSYSNVVPASIGNICIMQQTETVTSLSRVLTDFNNQPAGGTGTRILSDKTRQIGSLSLSASIPFLGARQLSVLGALNIQRLRR